MFEIELSITNIIISSIYRHPSLKKDSYLCLNTFIEFFSQFQNKQIILCSDFNIDLLDDNIHTNNFVNTLQLNNLFQSINNPTRITDKTAKLIDNICYNRNESNICSGILKYYLTNHLPLFIILDIENQKIKNVQKIKKTKSQY